MGTKIQVVGNDLGIMGSWSPCRPIHRRGRACAGVDVASVCIDPEPYELEYLLNLVDLVAVEDDRRDRHAR